ncbi:hypothetical protein DLAC_10282 [Tieghemostelium lacteum]|uniref:Uncharacterized protein n=1 Tax=Tieghemostelium lacteum TaxID=361077 RepID=A0A151Z516_TIELA|nr:hypothetical protein DLAC_10282 [Tieghemostelium lacteum]|eukprot:KYQ89056.1 hypothetical protein DLAC_10282 [Tieghemostelium lacteum]
MLYCQMKCQQDVREPHEYQGSYYYYNSHADCAFIRLSTPPIENMMNPCCSEGSPDLFPDGFAYPRETPNNGNSYYYQIINPMTLEPGTEIVKLGNISGFTKGLFHARHSGTVTETNADHTVCLYTDKMIIKPIFYPFTEGGDSGSIYYAVCGNVMYPVAVHNTAFRFIEPGGVVFRASAGTILFQLIEDLCQRISDQLNDVDLGDVTEFDGNLVKPYWSKQISLNPETI